MCIYVSYLFNNDINNTTIYYQYDYIITLINIFNILFRKNLKRKIKIIQIKS